MQSVPDRLKQYELYFAGDHGAQSSAHNCATYLKPFEDWLDGEEITGEVLANYRISLDQPRTGLNRRGRSCYSRSPAYKNRILGAVKAYLNWLRSSGRIEISKDTIYDVLKGYKRKVSELPRVLYRDELKRLIKAVELYDGEKGIRARRPMNRFIIMGLLTFARRRELLEITWRDVDFARQLVRVRGTKTGVVREVPFKHSRYLHDFLMEWKSRDRHKDMWLERFVVRPWTLKPAWPNQWNVRFQKLMKMADIQGVTPQVLRRTGISYLASAKFYPEVHLNIMAGHSGQVSKRFYQHPVYDDLSGATHNDLLEDFMGIDLGEVLGQQR